MICTERWWDSEVPLSANAAIKSVSATTARSHIIFAREFRRIVADAAAAAHEQHR